MYLGIDLGTSSLKALLLDTGGRIVAQASAPLDVSRPHPQWSEQSPADWWRALGLALGELARAHAGPMREVRAIGLSGQMHGAVLLDARGDVLRHDASVGGEQQRLQRRGAEVEAEIHQWVSDNPNREADWRRKSVGVMPLISRKRRLKLATLLKPTS